MVVRTDLLAARLDITINSAGEFDQKELETTVRDFWWQAFSLAVKHDRIEKMPEQLMSSEKGAGKGKGKNKGKSNSNTK